MGAIARRSTVGTFGNTITNRGTIIGDIRTDSGKDTFNLSTGSSVLAGSTEERAMTR